MKSLLITGGCGFRGTSLIARLVETVPAPRIRILDNLSVGCREDLGEVCKFRAVTANAVQQSPEPEKGDRLRIRGV